MAIERKQFTGGLNSDTEDRLVPNGDYRYALNCRLSKSDGSNEGSVENTKGNSLVNFKLPEGINRVIGSFDNISTNKVFFFLFNNYRNHTIYEYDVSNNTTTIVLQSRILNFQSTAYINDADMIDDVLLFNDRVNPPRMINVERMKSGGYPLPLTEDLINVIVSAPGFPPEAEYSDEPDVKSNNVRGKMFQFRYKYVYADNQESAWSPISKTPLPENEASFRPFLYYPTNINNVINVEVELSNDYVKKIKIAAREGNTGDFFLVADLDKDVLGLTSSQNTSYIYKFYNDEVYTSIDNEGSSGMRLFDNVPQLADSMSLIDGNRLSFGGVTENYDPVDVDIDIKVNQEVSEQVPPPNITHPLNAQHYNSHGFDFFHYIPSEDVLLKTINGVDYRLLGISKQTGRPSPTSSALVVNNGTLTPAPFGAQGTGYYGSNFNTAPFQGGVVRDRAIKIQNTGTGKTIFCGDSAVNEIIIDDPQASGIRFVLSVRIEYINIGENDAQKTQYLNVQYTSVPGDTAADICNALKNQLILLGTFTNNFIDIKADKTQTILFPGGWSYGNQAAVPSGKAMLRINGEAYVPGSKSTPGSPSWITAAGPGTGALYYMTSSLIAYSDWTTRSNKSLKKGATHSIGMVYMDSPNRSGLTNLMPQKTFYVPFFTEMDIPNGSVPNDTTLTVNINHTPPEWADRYQFVYSGNQTVDYLPGASGYKGFIHFKLKNVATSNTPGAKECTIQNIIDYNDFVPEDIDLGYSYTKGDRIRFISNPISAGNVPYLQDYRDVEVVSFDNTTNKLTFKDPGIPVSDNMLVEIYTPKKKEENLVYVEVGECYPIENGKHLGNVQDQTHTSPAIVDLLDIGDVYLRYRIDPIGAVVEDYSYSDYYVSDSWDKGRPNIVDKNIKRTKRKSTIRFSNPYIPSTNINGLSEFDDFSFEEYEQQYGTIERMYAQDKDLIVFQNLKVGKVRIGQTTLYGNEGNAISTLKSQDKVLSDIVYYQGEFGIGKNPESFAVYGNRLYFTDVPRGAVLRLGGDGITPISEYLMHNYFNDAFKKLINDNKIYKIFGVYDVRFDEYIISIQSDVQEINVDKAALELNPTIPVVGDILEPFDSGESSEPTPPEGSEVQSRFAGSSSSAETGEVGEAVEVEEVVGFEDTLSFSEIKKRWVTFYSYVPDYMVSNNIDLITFKDGAMYRHNKNALYNNFYGIQDNMVIRFLSNVEPTLIKFYNNIFTESTHPFAMTQATNQFGQKTSLIESDFVDDEGVYKSELLMDENTPNVANPLIEGDNIRCHSLDISLQNSEAELVKLFGVGIGLNPSQLTGK